MSLPAWRPDAGARSLRPGQSAALEDWSSGQGGVGAGIREGLAEGAEAARPVIPPPE